MPFVYCVSTCMSEWFIETSFRFPLSSSEDIRCESVKRSHISTPKHTYIESDLVFYPKKFVSSYAICTYTFCEPEYIIAPVVAPVSQYQNANKRWWKKSLTIFNRDASELDSKRLLTRLFQSFSVNSILLSQYGNSSNKDD